MPKLWLHRLSAKGTERLDEARIRLARPDALLWLALMGLLTGVVTAGVIVVFRLLVEGTQEALLPGAGPENFEALLPTERMLFPIVAAVLLAAMFRWFSGGIQRLGVASVLERMGFHQGHISMRAFSLQFAGAALAIIGGHSVGREGPHVFLGSAVGSLLGQRLILPHNAIRTLVGCGTAAAIAASFNTPLAGVIFALEVVMMEYSVASFIPAMLAAASAASLSNAVFGDYQVFSFPAEHTGTLHELLLVLLLGLVSGAVSAAYIQLVKSVTTHTQRLSIGWRMLLAGVLMAGFGLLLPEVMGIGYDSVAAALGGGFAVSLLAAILLGKLLATSCCIGLGVPGGTIGPALFMGAMVGALLAKLAAFSTPEFSEQVGLFALLGMGAMMSGSLQAPMAALTAMLELTDNPDIILPGMLVVVISGLTTSELFGRESIFLAMLRSGGLHVSANPLMQALRRIGVASVMERNLVRLGREVSLTRARELLNSKPSWLVVSAGDDSHLLIPAADLARFVGALAKEDEPDTIDLLAIPAHRLSVAAIDLQANLEEAHGIFEQKEVQALIVKRRTSGGMQRVFGVLTPEMVERAYRF